MHSFNVGTVPQLFKKIEIDLYLVTVLEPVP